VCYDGIASWWKDIQGDIGPQILTMGGYAGTGKSTLVSIFAAELACSESRVAFCAYTGKAANGLRRKLEINKDLADLDWGCSTIHGLIYEAKICSRTGAVLGFKRVDDLNASLIIVDEASMVTEDIFRDLKSYGIPILAIGDHGQLPPIQGAYALMMNPMLRLEKIHRQAEDNPIIKLSADIRNGVDLWDLKFDGFFTQRFHDFPSTVNTLMARYFPQGKPDSADYTAVLTGFNKTRSGLNLQVQQALGLSGGEHPISVDDRVICLKNAHFPDRSFVANGSRGRVEAVKSEGEHWLQATIAHEEDGVRLYGRLSRHQFGRGQTFGRFEDVPFQVKKWGDVGLLYDLGYAMTVHKAQGSQFARTIVFVERLPKSTDEEFRRWLYTACTRAEQELVMVF
jgi:exodeoxyribonuclease-5